jgi:dimethylargininase
VAPTAIVRDVPPSFDQALCATPVTLDVPRAAEQHAAYRAALAAWGLRVERLPADPAYPDGCFVEDTAVVAGELAVITRPGAPSRQGEVDAVAAALARLVEITRMQAPATLDGGDVLRAGKVFVVGRSARTNEAGIAALRAAVAPRGYEVRAVPMEAGVLHLKCVCSPIADDLVLVAEGTVDHQAFAPARVIVVPREEAYAANAVAWNGRVLLPAGYLRTRALVEAAGFAVTELDNSELRKADSALTCLSVLVGT